MAQDGISNGADGAAGLKIGEDAGVEVGLLEVEVELLALVASSRVEVGENLRLQAVGEGVIQLNLGSQQVGSVPRLGDADACAALGQQGYCVAGVRECSRRVRQMKYIRMDAVGTMKGYFETVMRGLNTVGERLLALELFPLLASSRSKDTAKGAY